MNRNICAHQRTALPKLQVRIAEGFGHSNVKSAQRGIDFLIGFVVSPDNLPGVLLACCLAWQVRRCCIWLMVSPDLSPRRFHPNALRNGEAPPDLLIRLQCALPPPATPLAPTLGPTNNVCDPASRILRRTWFRNLVPEPGSGTWYRNLVPELGTGTWFRNLVPEPGTGAWYGSLVREPGTGAWYGSLVLEPGT